MYTIKKIKLLGLAHGSKHDDYTEIKVCLVHNEKSSG
jgi:hypothetical protein